MEGQDFLSINNNQLFDRWSPWFCEGGRPEARNGRHHTGTQTINNGVWSSNSPAYRKPTVPRLINPSVNQRRSPVASDQLVEALACRRQCDRLARRGTGQATFLVDGDEQLQGHQVKTTDEVVQLHGQAPLLAR